MVVKRLIAGNKLDPITEKASLITNPLTFHFQYKDSYGLSWQAMM